MVVTDRQSISTRLAIDAPYAELALWGRGRSQRMLAPWLIGRSYVHFANGQGDSFTDTLEEARKRMLRRAQYDPPPPGIFPAAIIERGPGIPDGERVVERYPATNSSP